MKPTLASTPAFDEMVTAADQPRPSWAPVWAWLNNLSRRELDYADQQVQRELNEQEITASVEAEEPGDASGRLWQLDSVPFVLDRAEWQQLVAGLGRRADALEAVLQDLYGPRRLLATDWFPRQVVYEHPGYLRPLVGQPPARFLQLYAVDLLRAADGAWRIVADRCQAPFGLGYALQNRLVIGRSLPDLYQQTRVQALAPFFDSLVAALRHRAPVADPRIVLFGSRRGGGIGYEEAFLARYLDIDLVTAEDCTVRDRRLWLKTLGGLTAIDVAVRLVEDGACDPLHLWPDSTVGVPGLIDAVRAGNLQLANGLGAGLVDSPALLPLIDRCAAALGCDAGSLPTVATRWCGAPGADAGLGPDEALLSTWRGRRQQPAVPALAADTDALAALRARPADFVAMQRLAPSRAPAWDGGILARHAVVLRLFLLADPGGGWQALPGGLVRAAADPAFVYTGSRRGGTSKDCWVPTATAQTPVSPPQLPGLRTVTWRSDVDLPSSGLDDLFWFGRACEGIDHLARLLRAVVTVERSRLLGERTDAAPLFDALVDQYLGEAAEQAGGRLAGLVFAPPPALSLHQQLGELVRLARNARGWLSGDTWLLVRDLRRQLLDGGINRAAPLTSFDRFGIRALIGADALVGTLLDNMVRDHTWTFVALGRHLQRGLMLANLLATAASTQPTAGDLLLALAVADSAVTWRSRWGRQIDLQAFTDLLADQAQNPRALAFQLASCEQLLTSLPGMPGIGDPLLGRLDSIAAAVAARQFGPAADGFQLLTEAIDHRWFSHALPVRSIDRSQVTV